MTDDPPYQEPLLLLSLPFILGKKIHSGKKNRQAKQFSSLLAEAFISGAPSRGWNREKEDNITQQISLRKHRAHCTECNGTVGQIAKPGPIWYLGLNRIQLTKPNLLAATVSACYFFPRKKCGHQATLYKISFVQKRRKDKLKDREVERKMNKYEGINMKIWWIIVIIHTT